MSRDFPELVDPWAMVKGRRGFSGTWPLARMRRLAAMLLRTTGEARFELQFDVDETGMPYVEVVAEADCWLECQRTLEPFELAVRHRSRLGIIAAERDEAALPEGYEPLLVDDDPIRLIDLVEDELILALPLVPRSGDAPRSYLCGDEPDPEPGEKENPFSVLQALKSDTPKH